MEEIKRIYFSIQEKIRSRLNEFDRLREKGNDGEIFAELIFCILTPQSKAQRCWKTVETLLNKNLLLKGNEDQISKMLKRVRFRNRKAEYIVEARKHYPIRSKIKKFDDIYSAREWLVQNVRGMGYKEASHFLRNIGFGEELAILDRHILKNLKSLGVIEEIPRSLTKKKYFEIEKKMKKFSEKVEIPMSHLDLVLWYKETGEVFK
ncbi:MAG: N-glycosylase/DNA lyase [Methanomicrobia archaeon]|nr:N-glycosylase/DNA lyase [Methanomicrobia archaeon]